MKVLLLGDSHTVGSYGKTLKALFEREGHVVDLVGRIGASANSYLTGGWKKLSGVGDFDAVRSQSYDLLVLSLGTNDAANMAAGSAPAAQVAAAKLKQLADAVQATQVVYVGPPAFSGTAALNYNPVFKVENLNSRAERLWQATAPLFSRALDPRSATQPFVSLTDIHFKAPGGEAWAAYVYDAVKKTGSPSTSTSSSSGLVAFLSVVLVLALVRFKATA